MSNFRRALFGFVAVAGLMVSGCRRQPASAEDCKAILDRIIELELDEAGYHDPVVRARWQQELARRFATDLERCHSLTLRRNLRPCLERARTPDDIAHRCLD